MRAIIARRGGKSKISKYLVSLFPKQINKYVEPFVGGGSVFFELEKCPMEVINDKDRDISTIYQDLQTVDKTTILNYDFTGTRDKFNDLLNSCPNDAHDRLYRNLFLSKYSYLGNRINYVFVKNRSGQYLKNNIQKYQDRLKETVILNEDYKTVISKYDSQDTFFYLDPPYIGTNDYKDTVNHEELFQILGKIKGKFLMSLNNDDVVKQLCEVYNFKLQTIETSYNNKKGSFKINESIITNYLI